MIPTCRFLFDFVCINQLIIYQQSLLQPIINNLYQTLSYICILQEIHQIIIINTEKALQQQTPMKIRFLSKKQRQELKNKKQTQLQNGTDGHTKTNNHELDKKQIKQQLINQQYGGDINIQQQSDNQQFRRQRSREKYKKLENKELSQLQKQEIVQMKKRYLGKIKEKRVQRFQDQYKEKLLFQWDKSDDTSGGALNKGSMEALKRFQEKFKNKRNSDFIGKTWKEKHITEMTERDWRIFRQDNQIFIKGGRVPAPFRQWKQYDELHPRLISKLQKMQYLKPKPIQMQSIPIGISQKDMIAIAPTGQGKTLAFLIPIMVRICNLPRITAQNAGQGPYAIILVPSRQLAEQINEEFRKFTFNDMKAITVIGGLQLDLQILQLQKGCDILVGTPGRVKQLIDKHVIKLQRTFFAVIDEADKMISENLVDDVENILDAMQMASRQNSYSDTFDENKKVLSMFSATMLPQIEKLTRKYLVNPVSVTIGELGAGKKQIQQHVQLITQAQKNDVLGKILKGLPGPIIVFVNSRVKCEKLAKYVQMKFQRSCSEYHGGKTQQMRQYIIQNFRQGKFQVLVATDLGGRGLDIKGISAAISYDAPKNISQFIHRAGRSGRAGVKGKAFTLLTNQDEAIFYDIRIFLQRNQFKVPKNLRQHPASQFKPGTIKNVSRRNQVVYSMDY